ncbi:MAG TPA: hypothetical protein DC047_17885, partial [Blastocatellia bacterium]|nr:hypothetical protein [Blastocatellia bacterium]
MTTRRRAPRQSFTAVLGGGSVFEKNKIRISELETRIAGLDDSIRQNESLAQALLAQGERSAGRLKDYFGTVLKVSSDQFAELLGDRPLPSVAGWGEPGWQSWDVSNSRDESFIRAGDLVEQRS